MKAFRFPLERVLHWRRTQLELDKTAMQQLAARRTQLDNAVRALTDQRAAAEHSIARPGTVDAFEFSTMSAFQGRVFRQKLELLARQKELERETAAQVAKTMESQRRVRLLERLREKHLAKWTTEVNAEQERFAAEAWLGRWPILKSGDAQASGVVPPRSQA